MFSFYHQFIFLVKSCSAFFHFFFVDINKNTRFVLKPRLKPPPLYPPKNRMVDDGYERMLKQRALQDCFSKHWHAFLNIDCRNIPAECATFGYPFRVSNRPTAKQFGVATYYDMIVEG